ncbi:hypothetical protein [Paenibacillus sp. P22]|uniref:XkdQ/YqbQ family protein n=1 Tax=Paenibacillus sp. P22 TaxID=483908 RepID=UPI00038FCF83|nr:hypothetical protein [Paenibacillus sp. P22]CDN41173.1 Uncharacterized protein YqbQ [Paenibacillus sp. P22]
MIRVLYDGKTYIDALVTSVEWSGDIAKPYRTLTVQLSNTLDGDEQAINFEVGKEIRFYADNAGLFRGIIFTYEVSQSGSATITAYDENVYLTKNMDTRKFVGKTASAIIREICSAFGVPVGTIAETGYVIPRMVLRNKDLWDMMLTALTETSKQNGKKYRVYSSSGRLYLAERKDAAVRWMLEDGVNILTASRSQSIEETRTTVKVIGGDDEKAPLTATATDSAMKAKYGTMQHLETADSKLTQSQIQQLAKQRLADLAKIGEEVTVEALGLADVVAGSAIYAFESMTDVAGGYYVSTDRHTWEGGVHRMSVTLSRTYDLPKLPYEDDEAAKAAAKKKKKKKGGAEDWLLAEVKAVNGIK